jgi:hypothetical protein
MNVCNETNLMHYLSSFYSITLPLPVSGLLVAHHQEVIMYICNNYSEQNVTLDLMEFVNREIAMFCGKESSYRVYKL